ncbi:helix-turn-helix transcriptional regulator [Clostridium beijerinckii]|uniref:DNA-binding XRE family transcriptional regulator n=1 Tax=Clostridium beijerinckii TaxID=1520 RepID=A0A9Q5D1Y5_CLOBE|nr:helix-turn-helix transcriptional regulator [Clostridium beijerinckii]AQS04170.1 helix-turn-helix domain protein [Clostridium beijerinckii]MBA2883941.1 DNA-binding XRE family transcriptional regulator [Clostridium beijerinckii]MBA2899126.1 DNA-binding XRE family transcriptional regulator [Clostridium beijerinckii]MBA2908526.1 DNA-binding XRE family transcriptional regulator [Clostridium beijerinckii]MBA9016279.1 DNA-binding XRE family transcriptional regulator [Clostridium beijerinckii]
MGMNLKIARIKKGVKQIDLARKIHVSPATLIKWEKGIELDNIKFGIMKKIAELLDTSIEELFLSEN